MKRFITFCLRVFSSLKGLGAKRWDGRLSNEERLLIESLRKAKAKDQKVPLEIDLLNTFLKDGPFSSMESLISSLITINVNINHLHESKSDEGKKRKIIPFLKVLLEIILALFSGLATYLLY